MRYRAWQPGFVYAVIGLALFVGVCLAQTDVPSPPIQSPKPFEPFGGELRKLFEEQLQDKRAPDPGATAERPNGLFRKHAEELASAIRQRVQARIQAAVEREFGPMLPLQTEQIELEALDDRGYVIKIPVDVAARPLRPLNVPSYASRAYSVLQTDGLGLVLYDTLPESVSPDMAQGYRRIYSGEEAEALAAEARLVVSLKGGEWREPQGRRPAANAMAVRGLDLNRGLGPNGNSTYDDTMYLIIDAAGAETEVYECRMTTESSSTDPGVGRLNSMQVIYVRGLHRGKDPAYKLKGNQAEGTRSGLEGEHLITGANMHSAYTKRVIDSTTPLSPNVSLGCQVVAASKQDFEKTFVSLLDRKGIKEFPYTIIEGDELAMLNRTLNERGKHSLLVEGIPRPANAAS